MDVLSGTMKLYLILVFSAINEFNSFAAAQLNASKELELMGFLPMEGTSWTGGGACLSATQMAVRNVNEKQGLLGGYNISYTWTATRVYVLPFHISCHREFCLLKSERRFAYLDLNTVWPRGYKTFFMLKF